MVIQERLVPGSLNNAVASPPNNIVAFVGENENGILRSSSQELMDLAAPYGFAGHTVNLADVDWQYQLRSLLDRGVLFAWGYAGIGARLNLDDQLLWDKKQVPFISVMSDNPCYMPINHQVSSKFVANGYVFDDWLKIQRRLIQSPQISSRLPLAIFPSKLCDKVSWSQRPHRMVLVKTGSAPEDIRAQWARFPKRFRMILEDTVDAVLRQGVCDISDVFLECLDHHGLYLEKRLSVLFGLMCEADRYVRDHRSTAMVKGLLNLPVDIIGRGWDHVATLGSRAKFHEPVDASVLPELYANTQFLLNTMPNFSTGTHERVLNGFSAKCCVVTNENDDMHESFGSLPSYFAVDTEAADLSDRMASIYHSPEYYDDQLQPARDLVSAEFNADALIKDMIKLASEVMAAARAWCTETSGH